jgi:hypothetical protein
VQKNPKLNPGIFAPNQQLIGALIIVPRAAVAILRQLLENWQRQGGQEVLLQLLDGLAAVFISEAAVLEKDGRAGLKFDHQCILDTNAGKQQSLAATDV